MPVNLRPTLAAQYPNRPTSSVSGPKAIATTANAAIQRLQREQVANVLEATNPATPAATRTLLLANAETLALDAQRLHALQLKVDQLTNALTTIANSPVQTTNVTIHDVNKLKGLATSELRRQR